MFSSLPHMSNCRYFEQEWIVIQYIAFADANVWNVSVKLPITELELKIAIILLLTYCASNIQYCIQKYRPYNYAYSFVLLQLEFKQQHWAICSTGTSRIVWFNSSRDVKKTLLCYVNVGVTSRLAPSQRETALLCNNVSHWLGANLDVTPTVTKHIRDAFYWRWLIYT